MSAPNSTDEPVHFLDDIKNWRDTSLLTVLREREHRNMPTLDQSDHAHQLVLNDLEARMHDFSDKGYMSARMDSDAATRAYAIKFAAAIKLEEEMLEEDFIRKVRQLRTLGRLNREIIREVREYRALQEESAEPVPETAEKMDIDVAEKHVASAFTFTLPFHIKNASGPSRRAKAIVTPANKKA